MKYTIGSTIRSERKKRGWDQAELVKRLGNSIRQQAVSGWERGSSRPTREMIHILSKEFEIDEASLLKEAGYLSDTASNHKKPVRPLLTTLPLSDLPFDRFEQFSADLIAYLNTGKGVSVDRYGAQGHTQNGADIIATKDGLKQGLYQCKRVKQFGPAAVKKAIEDTSLVAEKNYILLTRVATPDALEEILKHENWFLWDVEKISQLVRQLPIEQALRLVETYFPGGWRKQFLGIEDPGPWATIEEFFQRFSGDQIFTHSWQLVGQEAALSGIRDFLNDAQQKIGVISGRGGSGKTRLLREVTLIAENELGYEVRFLGNARKATAENYELLRDLSRLLLVIDDAHERSDIAEIIENIHNIQPAAKIIIALRPYGFSQLSSDLRRIGIHPSEFPSWEVEDIKFQDAERLAQEVLGSDFPNPTVAQRLAHLTNDCPLITVVGAGLVKRGELDVLCLENDASIKEEILSRFKDTFIEYPRQGDPTILVSLLNAISALQPFPLNDEEFRNILERLCGRHWDELIPYIRRLEDKGVFLRRGNSLRIVPDLLGDVILAEACFDTTSSGSTGYIERLHQQLQGKALQNLIVNAARVDWQINASRPGSQSLVEFLWPTIINKFKSSNSDGRFEIMKLLKKVAFFQPEQALTIVRLAMEKPTSEDSSSGVVIENTSPLDNEYVLHEIPSVLKQVAYNFDFLEQAMDILWELAREDDRGTNQYPSHPLRALQEIASYERWKPAFFNEAIVGVAKRWFNDTQKPSLYSPFDVLDTLLATESSETLSEGVTLTFRPFSVRFDAVKKIRESVIDIAFLEADLDDISRSARAIKAIGLGIHYPVGMFNRVVTNDERALWTPSFIETIKHLGKLGTKAGLDPELVIAIRKSLQWHAKHSPTETKKIAGDVLETLPNNLPHQLALALHSGWGELVFEHISDYKLRDERRQNWYKELADEITAEYSEEEVVSLMENRLEAQRQITDNGGFPNPFTWVLVSQKVSLQKIICQRIVDDQNSVLVVILPIVLSQMMEDNHEEALKYISKLLTFKDVIITRSIAHALGWNRGNRESLPDEEFALLTTLAKDRDTGVRSALARVVYSIADKQYEKAIQIASFIEFGDSLQVAKEVFSVFGEHGVLKLQDLSAQQYNDIWRQLKILPSIDDYSITAFLSEVSKSDARIVLDLLRSRIEYDEEHPELTDFRALPFHWEHDLNLERHTNFQQLLREIRDWIAEKPNAWSRKMEGARLFEKVAKDYSEPVLKVLEEGIYSGLPDQFEAVAYILREAPKNLVWNNVAFIERILEASKRLGADQLRHITSSLISAVESGAKTGKYGEPFDADVRQRDKALEIAESLVAGTLTEKFYRTLAESAEKNIDWHAKSYEKMSDNREW